ncbi:heterokaryon incompatibility protein-domain-containing protein, partial [Podospora didyma]
QLPPTFQDSIQFCLALNVRYLWIDALCIIQDDSLDWQIKSSKMADIYRNAYITLAATSSNSGSGGCFAEQRIPAAAEHTLHLSDDLSSLFGDIRFREAAKHWTTPLTRSSSLSYPLLTRGWVFQERVLSPRVLHFCAQEMVWECNTTSMCECRSLPIYNAERELLRDILENSTLDSPVLFNYRQGHATGTSSGKL